ncbi:STAS-like domain-containing protein [Planktothricoides sp. FACHB-1370]|uniref:STAS-like domain-containing protein n=1 Tax=Planktothricoides raciborskii FACHB-1370 TaxID=2949576 RepID=A0ABR8EAB0_9CYAN|nr:STAS-like domain-containing protein [Planktothricoides raciborskii FACHB-1370]MBD2580994.1 STAS-like domain-containing protein [Planktothricoides raciborskii FACHB-1261]
MNIFGLKVPAIRIKPTELGTFGRPVELDFAGVEIFASPFFNFAIGQLLRDISPDIYPVC